MWGGVGGRLGRDGTGEYAKRAQLHASTWRARGAMLDAALAARLSYPCPFSVPVLPGALSRSGP